MQRKWSDQTLAVVGIVLGVEYCGASTSPQVANSAEVETVTLLFRNKSIEDALVQAGTPLDMLILTKQVANELEITASPLGRVCGGLER